MFSMGGNWKFSVFHDRVILVRYLNAKIVIYVGIRIIFFISEVKEFDMVNYYRHKRVIFDVNHGVKRLWPISWHVA